MTEKAVYGLWTAFNQIADGFSILLIELQQICEGLKVELDLRSVSDLNRACEDVFRLLCSPQVCPPALRAQRLPLCALT